MIESQGDRSGDRSIDRSSERTPADANNNDECKPLTLLSEPDTSKCLELNTALQASTSETVLHHRHHTNSDRSNQQGSSRTAASHTAGSSTGSNVANSAAGATTAGNYVPQQPKSERKAAKTLSAILLAFIITWTPYNVVALLRSTLDKDNQDYIPKPVSVWDSSLKGSFEFSRSPFASLN